LRVRVTLPYYIFAPRSPARGGEGQLRSFSLTMPAGQITCGGVATQDRALYVDQYANGDCSTFAKVGGMAVGNPSCTTLAANKVLCVMVGVSNEADQHCRTIRGPRIIRPGLSCALPIFPHCQAVAATDSQPSDLSRHSPRDLALEHSAVATLG
jgi:hypothetical protein